MDSQAVHLLRDLPGEERPRERMLQYGAGALSHSELLAILIRTGRQGESAVHLAQRVLNEAGTLKGLADLNLSELMQIKGVGPAKAVQIKAGIELGLRLSRRSSADKVVVRSPHDAYEAVAVELRDLRKEHFVCLFLNTKNHVIGTETLSVGSLNASIVHPREVFRAAIKCSSASIVCAHNHPSGDPAPSPEDISLTRRLVEAGRIVGIDVLDHIVVGDGTYVSLKEQGLM
ncbi:RadC family protein [Saccharibacillus deserti]|uniref:RadC family protein n=1 Tax=Saccharibacillus deserti TaxID=1634444 RepID=UPI001554F035|nr:DNA repair protein RadC [Saccharibacillus deserti]